MPQTQQVRTHNHIHDLRHCSCGRESCLKCGPCPCTKPQPAKTIKTCFIDATFPELPASRAYVSGRGEGGSLRIAASRAMANLMSSKQLKARRLHGAKMTVAFGFKTIEPEDKNDN